MTSNSTTWYGTYSDIEGQDYAGSIANALTGTAPTPTSLEAIDAAWRAALNDALPEGVTLHGEELVGPVDGDPAAARQALREWLVEEGPAVWAQILCQHLVEEIEAGG